MNKSIANLAGWLGMLLLQCATVPTLLGQILGEGGPLPPASLVIMVWSGLALYMLRAVADNDKLYMTSNGIGLFFNSILMALIIFSPA